MKKTLILIISIFTLFSCSKGDENNPTELKIRLSNVSQYEFQNIVVNTTNFENLNSRKKSEYKKFDNAYRYAFVQLDIDGKTYTMQPIDYVGETPLAKGKYTYQLDANDSDSPYSKLSLKLVKD